MKNPILIAMATALVVGLACRAYCQGDLAPLYLFTSGDGGIGPYQSGQMLDVGQTYDMTATPDAGYEFSSWNPVNVFVTTQTNFDGGDPILPPIQSIVPSLVPTNIFGADLEFTMQAEMAITSAGSNPNIVQDSGWQANFVPAPEPGETELTACGVAIAWSMSAKRRTTQRKVGKARCAVSARKAGGTSYGCHPNLQLRRNYSA